MENTSTKTEKCANFMQRQVKTYLEEKLEKAIELYRAKNEDYGDAFGKSYEKYGYVAGVIRMGDKLSRIESLLKKGDIKVKEESITDTLVDLAMYSMMLAYEIETEERI